MPCFFYCSSFPIPDNPSPSPLFSDPMQAAHLEDEELLNAGNRKRVASTRNAASRRTSHVSSNNSPQGRKKTEKEKEEDQPLETVLLEQTLTRIGALLAVGFGEAGQSIIGQVRGWKENERFA